MKIQLINYSDSAGGAARAAYRIHHALRSVGADSHLYVNDASTGDWTVQGPQGKWDRALASVRPGFGGLLNRLMTTSHPVPRSPSVLPSSWPRRIGGGDFDVVNLHWVNSEMMSVEDIGRINKPVAWTLHDMWAFCGAEHVTGGTRWRNSYAAEGRPAYETGLDIDRWVWRRKLRAWRNPMSIVCPSHWLAECARQSTLMRDWPISVVHNPIDTEVWRPIDKAVARDLIGLPREAHLLLFGTYGANAAQHKGFDLLRSALQHLRGRARDLQLVIFGEMAPKAPEDFGFPTCYVGHLQDELSLRVLYSAVDLMVIPSRIDNLPNTGVEAMACARPVVAFDVCGLPDVVRHQQSGYLAKPFDTEDLASGVEWVLEDSERYAALCASARREAVERFSYPVVAKQYLAVYKSAISL